MCKVRRWRWLFGNRIPISQSGQAASLTAVAALSSAREDLASLVGEKADAEGVQASTGAVGRLGEKAEGGQGAGAVGRLDGLMEALSSGMLRDAFDRSDLTQTVCKVVLQKSSPTQIRRLIRYVSIS